MERVLSTYRLQLNSRFRLSEARSLVPYLADLGISHLYCSPILKARPGSDHGYDVVDPTVLNPELGSARQLESLVDDLRSRGMGIVLDIVPNHMATGSDNPFWEDVLTHGPCSRFAGWFDIDWGEQRKHTPPRVFLPVLGDRLARVLARGELRLIFGGRGFRIEYFDQSFPVDPASIPLIFEKVALRRGPESPGEEALSELAALLEKLAKLPSRNSRAPDAGIRRSTASLSALGRLRELDRSSTAVRAGIEAALEFFVSGDERLRRWRRLLAAQAYRLAYWRRAAREINYRRFFTVSHLVAIRVERPEVFSETHAQILEWVGAGLIDGLRIDHIDGLLDPASYLERLQDAVAGSLRVGDSGEFPVFVEKILGRDERLRDGWPVCGTTGYDFANAVDDIFIDPDGFRKLQLAYSRFTRRTESFEVVVRRCKRAVLDGALAAEVRRLTRLLSSLQAVDSRPLDDAATSGALSEVLAHLPVYRTYTSARQPELTPADRVVLERAFRSAGAQGRSDAAALEFLREVLLENEVRVDPQGRLRFIERLQQLAVAVAAKGVEDTAFYVHYPLLSRNEVGGEPDVSLENAVNDLHQANRHRIAHRPQTMSCASTHDSKRSADVRARLAAIAEVPLAWKKSVRRWHRWNRKHRKRIRGRYAPDLNTEYLLYQTMVGIWPLPDATSVPSGAPDAISEELRQRIEAYMEKAIREAKQRTSWVRPDTDYEIAVLDFTRRILSVDISEDFLADVERFVRSVARPGLWNSLTRTLIQLAAPGTPDIYQGDELWNFNLVDPDNRRPVDFNQRRVLLASLRTRYASTPAERSRLLAELLNAPEDGRIKLHVVNRGLTARCHHPELFRDGAYIPLQSTGPHAEHVFAFARSRGTDAAIAVAPRLPARLTGSPYAPPVGDAWAGTSLALPGELAGRRWHCALSGLEAGSAFESALARLPLDGVLRALPVAMLISSDRGNLAVADPPLAAEKEERAVPRSP